MAFPRVARVFRATSSSRPGPGWVARATRGLAALAALALAPAVLAQDDLPARVGRVADLAGAVSIAPVERPDQWDVVTVNQTLVSGDNLYVSPDGRAEVDFGAGQFRLAGDANVHVARLDERALALFLAQGAAILRVRVLDAGDAVQVETPNARVRILRPGLYRVDVRAEPPGTLLSVREGEAEADVPSGPEVVPAGYIADISGLDAPRVSVHPGAFADGFDDWSAARDARYDRSRSTTYVSRQMIGYADLDEHGAWQQYPEYGAVWFPSAVAPDWAPYRYGRWTSVAGFGWTWVDDAPWGYAPFHYGRWAFIGGRWGWVPGGWVARPAWAPALVAWYGGPSWSLSVSAGGPVYGWVPLGWGEPYLPWWSNCSHRCWTAYNRPYAVRYTERPAAPPSRYVNQSAPGGFTAVRREALAGGQRVSRAVLPVAAPATSGAPVLRGAPVDVRPSPARIPAGTRAGAPGSPPPPASTFYPSARQSRSVGPSSVPEGAAERQAPRSVPAGRVDGGGATAPASGDPARRSRPTPGASAIEAAPGAPRGGASVDAASPTRNRAGAGTVPPAPATSGTARPAAPPSAVQGIPAPGPVPPNAAVPGSRSPTGPAGLTPAPGPAPGGAPPTRAPRSSSPPAGSPAAAPGIAPPPATSRGAGAPPAPPAAAPSAARPAAAPPAQPPAPAQAPAPNSRAPRSVPAVPEGAPAR